jgi:hypothetical protein
MKKYPTDSQDSRRVVVLLLLLMMMMMMTMIKMNVSDQFHTSVALPRGNRSQHP